MVEIATALSSFTALMDIGKGAIQARDDAKLEEAVTAARQQYIEALNLIISLQSLLLKSEKDLAVANRAVVHAENAHAHLEMKMKERERYAQINLASDGQHFHAYSHQPLDGDHGKQPHYLCQLCYDKDVKAVLHVSASQFGTNYFCPNCKTTASL